MIRRLQPSPLGPASLSRVSLLGVLLDTRPVFLMILCPAGISVVMPMGLIGPMGISAPPEKTGAPRPRRIEWPLPVDGGASIGF